METQYVKVTWLLVLRKDADVSEAVVRNILKKYVLLGLGLTLLKCLASGIGERISENT